MENYVSNTKIIHVLDDFLFVSSDMPSGQSSLRIFLKICKEIGVPISLEKTFEPQQI